MSPLTRRTSLALAVVVLAPLGCGTLGDSDADSAGARATAAPTRNDTMPGASFEAPLRLAATERYRGDSGGTQTAIALKTPESVKYDPELRVYYISNINGNPTQKDGNGFIVRIHADSLSEGGSVLVMGGGADSVVLNAPKGMALVGDTLWVADIDVVRGFNRRTGAPLATVSLSAQRAVFLNDIAVGPDGALYVTDTGIRFGDDGSMSHPGPDRIFRVTNRQVSVALQGDTLRAPNGIAWDSAGQRFIIAPFNGPALLSWKRGDRSPTVIASGPGGYDGVEVLADGRILVSSWADSSIHVVQDGKVTKLFPGVESPADIGVNTHRQHVAVPLFSGNRVEYWSIPAAQRSSDTARADSARPDSARRDSAR